MHDISCGCSLARKPFLLILPEAYRGFGMMKSDLLKVIATSEGRLNDKGLTIRA